MTHISPLTNRYSIAFVSLAAIVVGIAIAQFGIAAALTVLSIPVVALVSSRLIRRPVDGLFLTLLVAFFGVGLTRYAQAPTGLLVDSLLALTVLAMLMGRGWRNDSAVLRNVAVAFVVIWFVYNVGELFNPERPSAVAWFYAVRGVALYWILAVPAGLLLFRPSIDLDRFIKWWLVLSVIGTAWGLKQLVIGLDSAEQAWLSIPGNQTTHLLFGKLRVFSFYSDAGQFGSAQGHAAVVAGILSLSAKRTSIRIVLLASAGILLIGLLISGTRGAMAVPFAGFLSYLVLNRNWRILTVGLILLIATFSLLRYTYVGHGVYEIRRMRTAVLQGSENLSFKVRLENQRRLGVYLEGRPFGGGVGSAGSWGQRFSPDTFLANLALDSWYVKIWAEEGIVGLILYLALLAAVLIQALRRLNRISDETHRLKLLALFCGFIGVLVASYGNQVLGQMPTGIIVAFSLAFLFLPLDLHSGHSSKASSSKN
jgi:hypothetical protein